jgi:bleomycin hydrolase
MWTAYWEYVEKAKGWVKTRGKMHFGEGSQSNAVKRIYNDYGVVPYDVFTGLKPGQTVYDHGKMFDEMKAYLETLKRDNAWNEEQAVNTIRTILNYYMGTPPEKFDYEGKEYTPLEFAAEVLKYNPDNYINITSFTHHPFYKPFMIEVPDNFSGGEYYNVPLDEMILITKESIEKGYTVLWDADVSNQNFMMEAGYAMEWVNPEDRISINPDDEERFITHDERQKLFENLTTQDDHLMQFVGMKKSKTGKDFFLVKNSWNEIGKYKGFLYASEAYFALNTIAIIVVKDAIPLEIRMILGLN